MASCATARYVAAPACNAVFDNRHGKAIAARDFHVATETGKGSPYPALVYVALVR